MAWGPTPRGTRGQRLVAGVALAVLVQAGVGCRSSSRDKDFGPLSADEVEFLYLKRGVELVIHEVLTEGEPEALRRFFPPSARLGADCEAFYQGIMGAPPRVYQPRFWDMRTLAVRFEPEGDRAHTSLTIECADVRPGSGGAGRFVSLELTWVKQGGNWFLEPPLTSEPDTSPRSQ